MAKLQRSATSVGIAGTSPDGEVEGIKSLGPDGGELSVGSLGMEHLLGSILLEMRIMNFHLSMMTDTNIAYSDIPDA